MLKICHRVQPSLATYREQEWQALGNDSHCVVASVNSATKLYCTSLSVGIVLIKIPGNLFSYPCFYLLRFFLIWHQGLKTKQTVQCLGEDLIPR